MGLREHELAGQVIETLYTSHYPGAPGWVSIEHHRPDGESTAGRHCQGQLG